MSRPLHVQAGARHGGDRWAFNDYGPDCAGIQGADGEVGGLRRTEDLQTGGPLVILYSNDLEASLESVRSAGGTLSQEPFSFPGGRRFHFLDPSGNELAVWSHVTTSSSASEVDCR